jgi:hypothetical protein
MFKKTFIILGLPLLVLVVIAASLCLGALGSPATEAHAQLSQPARPSLHEGGTGTLQKMIVENGSVRMDLDLNGFDGTGSLVARPVSLQFVVGANSFFPILVFNDLLRGSEPGSMSLVPVEAAVSAAGASVSQATAYSAEAAAKAGHLPLQLGAALKQLVVEKLPSD